MGIEFSDNFFYPFTMKWLTCRKFEREKNQLKHLYYEIAYCYNMKYLFMKKIAFFFASIVFDTIQKQETGTDSHWDFAFFCSSDVMEMHSLGMLRKSAQ